MELDYRTHISHCCKWHGCKFGELDCPVATGKIRQEYLCKFCYNDLEDEEYLKETLKNIKEMKQFLGGRYNGS